MRKGLCGFGLAAALAWSGGAPAHDPVPAKGRQSAAALTPMPGAGDRPQQQAGLTLPMKPDRTLRFTTTSGTWMSLDVAPHGRTILFDLLGDLYLMPAAGGKARRLSGGMAFDSQPTYAPDGRSIAFVSDRSGSENIWLAKADGSAPRQLSFGDDDTVLASPAWAADGRSIFVSRYRSSLNNYELWRYDLDGKTSRVSPIRDDPGQGRDAWRSTLGAVASPDGKSVYFARRAGGLNFDEVDSWTIVRRDLATGQETELLAEVDARRSDAKGSFFRPALSPDGRLLAYASRIRNQTELRLRELATGLDRRIAFPIEHDQLQASMWQDIVPRYDFTPDGKALIVSRNGGFERIEIASGRPIALPFSADVRLAVGPSTRQDIREETGPVRARLIQSPVASPDGRRLAFSALARLYLADLRPGSVPVAVDTGGEPAFQPSWSPDGRQIAFITWSEKKGGFIWTIAADGSSPPVRRVELPAFYTYPVFSPDGSYLIAVRSAHEGRLATSFEYGKLRDAQLIEIPLSGGDPRVLHQGHIGSRAHFRSDKPNVVVLMSNQGLVEIDRTNAARTSLAQVQGPGWYFQEDPVPVDDARLSPDGKWILAQVAGQLHLVAAPPAGARLDLLAPKLPHRRVTSVGADFFEWSVDGKEIHWSVGSTFYRRPVASVALNRPDRPNWSAAPPPLGSAFPMVVEVPRAAAPGSVLLRGARVLTMAGGDKVIEDADLLVTGGRIAGLGRRGSFSVPAGAEVLDVTGKTIIPGFIDTHDHIGGVRREVLSLDDWTLQARLAFGVTTSFDPSTLSIDMLAYQDLLDAGMMVGPRIRQTAPAIFSMNRFESLDEVRAVLRRYRDHYRLRNIKQYRTGDRQVRQWMAMAARELGMHPTVEGALSMKLDLMQIIDGFAGHEHALPASLHDDVVTLMKEMRTSYTTTLQITNGGFPAQDWFIVADKPASDARVRRFWPESMIDSKLKTAVSRPLEEYRFPQTAADAAKVQRAGGLLGMGAHGDHPGIGYHFELGAHLLGGMTPVEILRAATIGSAQTIGRAADLGSLEEGKFADLLVLRRDPRGDLGAAREIDLIMKEGLLFHGATLDQLRPERVPFAPWWRRDEAAPTQWLPEAR